MVPQGDPHPRLNATAAGRLAKTGLTQGQVVAAALFERDHETARLEPSLTVNLAATGGEARQADALPAAVLDARNRQHAALSALRAAGPGRRGRRGCPGRRNGDPRSAPGCNHADRRAAKAWAGLALEVQAHPVGGALSRCGADGVEGRSNKFLYSYISV